VYPFGSSSSSIGYGSAPLWNRIEARANCGYHCGHRQRGSKSCEFCSVSDVMHRARREMELTSLLSSLGRDRGIKTSVTAFKSATVFHTAVIPQVASFFSLNQIRRLTDWPWLDQWLPALKCSSEDKCSISVRVVLNDARNWRLWI